jgi:hypothetical protein
MLSLVFVVSVTAVSLRAQTASTSTVIGTVSDKSGASVPSAKVELEDVGTKAKTSTTTASDGGYIFPSVKPGNYNITVSAKGFRQTVISGVRVEIGKSALVNAALEVGGISETVEVTAGTGVDLQTQDASLGNVLDSNMLSNMPNINRDATSLVLLQPMAIPGFNGAVPGSGEGNSNGGTIAGARMDQNTFMLDGGDATSNMEGGGGYNTGFQATPRAVVPTPVESLEEFRVQTNNAGVDFTRSLGAEVQMVTIRGTNNWHGGAYWYHQNDELNANDWFRARRPNAFTGKPFTETPEWRDNRAGGKIGGPIWKDRTFIFLFEEERHFLTQAVFQRLVPSAALRAGILKFKVGGVVQAFNLNPTPTLDPSAGPTDNDPRIGQMIPTTGKDSVTGAACDVGSSLTCTNRLDPRNLGISPAISATWNLLPPANDFSAGDAALRAPFLTSSVPEIRNEHNGIFRLDHKINDKWDFMGRYQYSTSSVAPSNIQVDVSGTAPGCKFGVPCNIATRPLQPRYVVGGLTGRLTPNLINEFHFDWLRHWWSWIAPGARIPVIPSSLSDTRLQIWQESRINGMVPINVNTQQARQRVWNGQDYTFIDNLSWIKGNHAWSFGGRVQIQHFLHVRDDKVVGGITTPLYFVARGGQFLDLGGIPIPAGVKGSDRSTYRRAYISALGMVDSATQVLTRAGDLSPQPAGSTITQKENVNAYEIYFGDTWRLTPSLTLSYGLTWGVQMPPYDPTGKTAMMIDVSTGKPIDAKSYLATKQTTALSGNVFNPTVGYVPIKSTGRKYPFDPDYTNLGPRLAVAWNPGFSGGPLGTVLGNKKTVLRGGWSRVFERKNGVGLVLTPALGIGFGDLSVCTAPGSGAIDPRTGLVVPTGCNNGGNPNTNFRIGVDGNHITVPPLPAVSGGVIIPGLGSPSGIQPANANSVFESRDFRLDPHYVTGGSDSIDLSIQRELPGKMILEVGYVGRWSRDLYGNIDLNSVPYMFTPKGTNQTFAQAFDAVAAQLQAGKDPSVVTTQPWFEAMLGGAGSSFCKAFASCTAAAAVFDSNNGNPFWPAHGAGALWTLLEPSFVTGPMILANTQVGSLDWSGSFTRGNYQAGFVTLRSRNYRGLSFDANYTFSHALDNFGITQECTGALPDAFDLHRSYAPSLFDRRHTFNLLVNYELPLGKGKGYATGALADKVLGGWSVSSIYTIASGLPDMVYDSNACGTEFGSTASNGNSNGLIPTGPGTFNETRVNNPTPSLNGYGSGSTGGVPNTFHNPNALGCPTLVQGCVDANGNPFASGLFRYPTFADKTLGFGRLRGPLRWNVDLGVSKLTRITERVSTRFDVQFLNAFNHPMFGSGPDSFFSNQPGADLSTPGGFGVPSNQFNSPRWIQVGLKFDF